MNEATIALCKCKESKKTYGVRFERVEKGKWKYTWAFPINEDAARREGYNGTTITGIVEPDDKYPGCPYCGAKYFIVCSCGKLNCNISTDDTFTCEWCGITGALVEEFELNIKSGGDR